MATAQQPAELQRELTPFVPVVLGGTSYRLIYSIRGIIFYKQKTAELDARRRALKPRLKPDEVRELRERQAQLLEQADDLVPTEEDALGQFRRMEGKARQQYEGLMLEATAVRSQLDEDAAAGDSLFQQANWRKINPDSDPDRFLLALMAGMQSEHSLQLSGDQLDAANAKLRSELVEKIDFSNVGDVAVAIAKALTAHLPKPAAEEAQPAASTDPLPAETASQPA